MRLYELTPSNNPIDKELARTAQGVEKNGSLAQGDIDAQDDIDAANEPMDSMGSVDDVEDSEQKKPVDSALMGKLQNHDYIQRYDHSDDSNTHPSTIMAMEMDDLSNMRTKVRVMLDRKGVEDRIGSYTNPDTKTAQDLLSFIDQVMVYKKQVVKNDNKAKSGKPKVRQQPSPKTPSGKRFKPKRN